MKFITCKVCGEGRRHGAHGLCHGCYQATWQTSVYVTCGRCRRERPHKSRGLCASCYNSTARILRRWQYAAPCAALRPPAPRGCIAAVRCTSEAA